MALDRFIYFREDSCPTYRELYRFLTNFIGFAGKVAYGTDRIFVELPGTPSFPFKGFPDTLDPTPLLPEQRWIEVWLKEQTVDVMTRHQDDFTHALADQIVELLKRYWKGTDEPSTFDTPQEDIEHTDDNPQQ